MAVGDKYVVTLEGVFAPDPANRLVNVFAYEGTAGAPNAADLWTTFQGGVVSAIAAVVHVGITFDLMTVINLDDLTDFFAAVSGVGGVRTGEFLPMFNGWELEYTRGSRAVHNGRKTFGVLSESDVTNGVIDATLRAGDMTLLEVALSDVLTSGGGTEYTPRIWRRAGTYVSGTFPDTFYPTNGVIYRRVSTQNTRKR
jgi:hypothetical protein